MTSRNQTIDIAKGLGIVLVVLGHSWVVRDKGELFRVIFSFHMPLFFFLAGVFINGKVVLKAFVGAKAHALLKPYFSTLLLFGLLKAGGAFAMNKNANFDLAGYLQGLLYATGNTIAWEVMWFLPHLFVASVAALCVIQVLEANSAKAPNWLAMCAAIFLAAGVYCMGMFWQPAAPVDTHFVGVRGMPGLPWSVDLLPVTAAFVLAGYLLRQQIKAISFSPLGLLLAVLVFAGCHVLYDETIDLNLRVYGAFAVSTIQAFSGIYMVLCVAALLANASSFALLERLSRAIAYVGAGSLFILIFHVAIQWQVFNALSKFSQNLFLNWAIGLAAGIVVPLLFWEFAKRSKAASALMLPQQAGRYAGSFNGKNRL